MKKFLGKFLIFSLAILTVAVGFSLKINSNELSDGTGGIPEVYAAESDLPENFFAIYNSQSVYNGQVVLLKNSSEFLSVSLVKMGDIAPSSDLIYDISINGNMADSNEIPYANTGAIVTFDGYYEFKTNFKLGSNPNTSSNESTFGETFLPEGKMVITFSYIEMRNSSTAFRTFSFTVYFFKYETYFYTDDNIELPNARMQNVSTANITNTTYSKNHYFNYINKTHGNDDAKLYLPYIVYNPKLFKLNLTKTYSGLTESCTVEFDGDKAQLIGNNFVWVKKIDDTQTHIIFNDLGEYDISYITTCYNNVDVEIMPFSTKKQKLYIFGLQLFYTNLNDGKQKEFKEVKYDFSFGEETDITYKNYSFSNTISKDDDLSSLLPPTTASTNQAPASFKFNVVLNTGTSYIYRLNENGIVTSKTNFEPQSFSDPGKYLIKIVYTFDEYRGVNGNNLPTQEFTQWFFFKLTSSTPQSKIQETGGGDRILPSQSFTKYDVTVTRSDATSIFDSDVEMKVTRVDFNGINQGETSISKEYTFSENGEYTLTVKFGKNGSKSTIQIFTIDKEPISDLTAFTVNPISTTSFKRVYKLGDNAFSTNENISVQWAEKASKAATKAYYKFVPLTPLSLETLGENYAFLNSVGLIRTEYEFAELEGITFNPNTYANTLNYQILGGHQILTNQGLYVFKIIDEAGNEAIKTIIIDKTPVKVLAEIENTPSNIWRYAEKNMTANTNVTLHWGTFKGIKFKEDLSNIFLVDPDLASAVKDFIERGKILSPKIYGSTEIPAAYHSYFIIPVANVAYTSSNSNIEKITANNWEIPQQKSGKANEGQFIVLIRDMSNTKGLNENLNLATPEKEQYLNYSSGYQMVIITSDSSESYLYSDSGEEEVQIRLSSFFEEYEEGVNTANINKKLKSFYYLPTKQEVVKFSFLAASAQEATGEHGTKKQEIAMVSMVYYPFEVDQNTKTYKLGVGQNFIIYKFNETSKIVEIDNTYILPATNVHIYEINTMAVSEGATAMTKPGKYVISRIYTEASTVDGNDFMQRNFTFYVDRFNVISEKTTMNINGSYETFSIVGGEIYINIFDGVVNGSVSLSVPFKDLYTYNQAGSNASPPTLFTTNKLPVKLYIPAYKYVFLDDGKAKPIGDLTYFKDSYLIASYRLNAVVEFFAPGATTPTIYRVPTTSGNPSIDSNGYLAPPTSTNGGQFSVPGTYTVRVTQDIEGVSVGDNIISSYSFKFEITNTPPAFQITDTKDNELGEATEGGQNYLYTNQPTLKVKWTDSTNEFMAKIDPTKTQLYYKGIYYKFKITGLDSSRKSFQLNLRDPSSSFQDETGNAFNKDLYTDGGEFAIIMQYEGNSTSYSSTAKTIIIDLSAPSNNIDSLVEKNYNATGITKEKIRKRLNISGTILTNESPLKGNYNVSVSDGNYRDYSFTVNKEFVRELFNNLITSLPTETRGLYIKRYAEGSKYNGSTTETSYDTFSPNSDNFLKIDSQTIVDTMLYPTGESSYKILENYYYEIVESDTAGNLSIYTIFIAPEVSTVLTYLDDLGNNKVIPSSQIENNSVNAYSKTSFAALNIGLNSDAWYTINFTVNSSSYSYLHTPHIGSNELINVTTGDRVPIYDATTKTGALYFSLRNEKYKLKLSNKLNGSECIIWLSVRESLLNYENRLSGEESLDIEFPTTAELNGMNTVIFASQIKITKFSEGASSLLYEATNNTGRIDGYSHSEYVSISSVTFNNKHYVRFKINNPLMAKYRYEFVDNYGHSYTEIHIYDPSNPNSPNNISITSSYQSSTLSLDGNEYYVAEGPMKVQYNATVYATRTFNEEGSDLGKTSSETNNIATLIVGNVGDKNNGYSVAFYDREFDGTLGNLTRTIYFRIYNIYATPKISDKNNNDITDKIIGNSYAGLVTIRFEDTSANLFPCKVEIQHDSNVPYEITSGTTFESEGSYRITVSYKNGFTATHSWSLSLTTALTEFYYVLFNNTRQKETGKPFYYDNNTKTIGTHYIVNSNAINEVEIVMNELQGVTKNEPMIIPNQSVKTYIYTISNKIPENANIPGINWFEKQIAISFIPYSTNFISILQYTKADGNFESLSDIGKTVTSTTATSDENFRTLKLEFNSYNQIAENKVSVSIEKDGIPFNPIIRQNQNPGNLSYIELQNSGVYTLSFKDIAGNRQVFNNNAGGSSGGFIITSDVYQLAFIKSVIIKVNDNSPIMNAVYNSSVVVSVPVETLSYYDSTGKPQINSTRNGEPYTNFSTNRQNFTFSETGLYEVWFTAKIKEVPLREEKLSFRILSPNESRLAVEYPEYGNYYIEKIIKGTNDVTEAFTNSLNASKVEIYGQIFLKELLVSKFDEKTGEGKYEITVNTNNEMGQKFTFKIWINLGLPIVKISDGENSLAEGTSTSNIIKISYNPFNIHEQVGDCYVRITGTRSPDILITNETLSSLSDVQKYEIVDEYGEHYIQIYTIGDKLLYSYKVIKTEPMNAVAIIVIVVGSIVAIGAVLLFIYVRKRIKVK